MNVLVTGGSGYLGTHIRNHFGGDDLSRRSGLDVLNLQDCVRVADYDVVIHLAALLDKTPEAAEEVFLVNVEGTVNVLQQVREDAAFIFASAKDVYGRFADNYSVVAEDCQTLYSGQSALEWSKLIAERYVEFYSATRSFRSCIFRISTPYAPPTEGNTPNFVGAMAEDIDAGRPIVLPAAGRPRRDLLHVNDLAKACEAFVDSGLRRGLYNIGGGPDNALALSELVVALEKASGLQATVSDIEAPAPIPENYVSDLTRITQELGWKPTTSVAEGLATLFTPAARFAG
jgi:nucleoside-diphosphate-sugar epimerase